jgi:hypothetical protein
MKCLEACKSLDVSCPISECRSWIPYEKEYNCAEEAVAINGAMTLREIAERLNISYVRVKQIQDSVQLKLKKQLGDNKNRI